MMQKMLEDWELDQTMVVSKNKTVSEQVRDNSYVVNQDDFISKREIVHKIILGHPEGITDQEISDFTGFSLSCVNGRRNELEPKPVVVALCIYWDEMGVNHMRSMWGMI